MTRLQREGRWREADAFKERERLRLRFEGYRRSQAVQQAWALMAKAFPPVVQDLGLVDIPYSSIPVAQPTAWTIRDDLYWAYRHLITKNSQCAPAPSGGATGLLEMARRDMGKFLRDLAEFDIAQTRAEERAAKNSKNPCRPLRTRHSMTGA